MSCLIAMFAIAYFFPKKGVGPRNIAEDYGILLLVLVYLLLIFLVFYISIIYYKKTTVDVTYNTIYYRTLFFEKEFMFDDITYIKSYLDGHQNNGFTKRYHLTMVIYAGKKKMKINTRMVNATKLWDLLIERGYLEKQQL